MSTLNILFPITGILSVQFGHIVEDQPQIVMSRIQKGTDKVIKEKSKLDYFWTNSIFSFEFSVDYGITSPEGLSHISQLFCDGTMALKLTKHEPIKHENAPRPDPNFVPEIIKLPTVYQKHLDFELTFIHKYFNYGFDRLNERCLYFSIHRDIKHITPALIKKTIEDFKTLLGIRNEEELRHFAFRFSIEVDSNPVRSSNLLLETIHTEMFQFVFNEEDTSLSVVFVDPCEYHC